jgi:hypothetical protein
MTIHGSPDAIEPDPAAEIFAEFTAAGHEDRKATKEVNREPRHPDDHSDQ